jgi:predicted aldo/keto reductase-like oxidoreductase
VASLHRRPLGPTGFEATRIGLGGIPIMRSSFERAGKIVHRALDLGVNYIDTARAYADSEEKIGQVMKTRREECFLATKSHAPTYKEFLQHVDTSLRDLKTDHVDLLQIHDVSSEERWEQMMKRRGTLAAAKRAQREGKCRFIGVTGHSIPILKRAVETGEFATVLCVYNLAICDTAEELMPLAREHGVGVIVMKPLSGGIFFRVPEKAKVISPEMAWNFVLQQEMIDVALAGAQWIKDIEQAVRCAGRFKPLTAKKTERAQKAALALGKDACRDCGYCLKECPEGIPIPQIMQLVDKARAFPYEWPKRIEEYRALEPRGDACKQCGACEEACPFNLPIMKRLERVHNRLKGML